MALVVELLRSSVPPVAVEVIRLDLGALDAGERAAAVDFVVHRLSTMPTIPRAGICSLSVVLAQLVRTPLGAPVLRWASRESPPLLGDYVRLVRGLVVSHVWETRG